MFKKILIANRGEIARRIIRTARLMGVKTVAVYSDADKDAPFAKEADEAIHIGPPAPAESYLLADRILEAAKLTGAEAIHPGYGFLSENAAFAESCAKSGVVFIGPPASSIIAMGDKSASKRLMREAAVPLSPGYEGEDQAPDLLANQAKTIGYPVMIKASSGGGGKGMRIVHNEKEFAAALASCQREAKAAFGDERVLIEKFIVNPRHVEIQVFADNHGNTVHLFERDCSAQRRHQKVIEEAPAPGLNDQTRAAMHKAAIAAAEAVGYRGAGTVEFLLDPSGDFYFMEMNTRLQVEHPVTEMITGLDLVEWQLRVAAGEPLPARQDEISLTGHAFEARIYAEDPDNDFLPATGHLTRLSFPEASENIRVDAGVEEKGTVSPHYDPMIAKLISWDETRERALDRLIGALGETRIVGLTTNVSFLSRLASVEPFKKAKLDTGLIEREKAALFPAPKALPDTVLVLAALTELLGHPPHGSSSDPFSPWVAQDGWRLGGRATRLLRFMTGEKAHLVAAVYHAEGYALQIGATGYEVTGSVMGDIVTANIDGHRIVAAVVSNALERHIFLEGAHYQLDLFDPLVAAENVDDDTGGLRAPMPGKIVKLFAAAGDLVERGAPLLVLEAMKMEHTILAPVKGKITAFLAQEGDQVDDGDSLVELEAEE
ncbi:acetyl/propionyl/methylcrotonyl-CoA carboxylase subunit alpha [Kiloniella laminariae]|uniref:Acetyl/propionyl/methylcrotonyl-CoA carboxylase subunit alpha n=1 Tax=Kiloniella laminariae TaxID=454162 RepID=A0ABT4LN52_9PROT|nr:acetyl/propionyl/methylcrotonyl-CoA carboxylase subunit alpha [Kiloniella laminariae]MCZ4282512.1 acetyl/propionyl/methylcrotonyl-CoA carboxylase subunit alpha [Kiloniella laminariae]